MNKQQGMRFALMIGAITILEVDVEVKGLFVILISMDKFCNISIKKNNLVIWCNRGMILTKMLLICSLALFKIEVSIIIMFIMTIYILYKYICFFEMDMSKYKLKLKKRIHQH